MPITDPPVFASPYCSTYTLDSNPRAQEMQLKANGNSSATSGLWLNTEGLERVDPSDFSHFDLKSHATITRSITHLSPFTPCLTPTLSTGSGSSAASSPRFNADVDPLGNGLGSLQGFNASRRASIDSGTSRSSSHWSMSPQLRSSMSPNLAPVNVGSRAPIPQPRLPNVAQILYVQPQATQSDAPPKKKIRRLAKPAPETLQPGTPSSSSLAIVAIPPAQASDLPFDPSKKPPARRGKPCRGKSSRSSRRRKSDDRPSSPQPIKFRFVSVQHSAQPDEGSSTAVGDEDEGRVQFEEHMEEEVDDGPFEHGPTELPPRPYPGGEYATSPLQPRKTVGKIPASNLDFLPVLEARFTRLENAIDRYIELRAQQALRNSILPSVHTPPLPRPQLHAPLGRQKSPPSRTVNKAT